uniref:Uncharacterized protein n=1 Tax=Neobodo designis TaxID=312471 RepID=A0A7S1QYH9_NEODS|mmetsp:Transcript_54760/g.168736  ORF Transcript_54760/g.168736 Transcript_54760/m.168736 type:complete len:171 (+) Transcript_54760:44-556(+)
MLRSRAGRTLPMVSAATELLPATARRFNASLMSKTKGNPHMGHLDLYARRDPQLAPYLLREVDIEFKRKCRKVNYIFWVAVFMCSMLYDQRAHAEVSYYLRTYAEMVHEEQQARDRDMDLRRGKLVGVMGVIKNAFERDGKWRVDDYKEAVRILRSPDVEASQVAVQTTP